MVQFLNFVLGIILIYCKVLRKCNPTIFDDVE